jgi:mono/diheme cytochrome c family protein
MATRLIKVFAVIGAVSAVAMLIGAVMLLGAVRRGFSARDQPSAVETALARAMRSWSISSRRRIQKNPVKPSPEVLADARAHWADHCAICHANDGSGDTQIGRNLYPKAPDMRERSTQTLPDGELYLIIENGIRLTGMPAWGHGASDDEDSWKLVAFIRHLPALSREEKQQMERMNPKAPDDRKEGEEEDDFLRGGRPPVPSSEHSTDRH